MTAWGLAAGECTSTTVACALKSWFTCQCTVMGEDTAIHRLSDSCVAMLAQLNERLKEYGLQNAAKSNKKTNTKKDEFLRKSTCQFFCAEMTAN